MEQKIKQLLDSKGVTLKKVASMCKVNYYDLSRQLGGKPNQVSQKKLDVVIKYLEQVNTNDIQL